MKTIKFIFCCALVFVVCLQTMGQYVTLQGRQFKDENGNDFYPLSVDYCIDLVNADAPSCNGNYYFAPGRTYEDWPAYNFKCNNSVNSQICPLQLDADLRHIESLGFNTVIVAGLNPWSGDCCALDVRARVDPLNTHGGTDSHCVINFSLGANDPIIHCIFNTLEQILDDCIVHHLKLMIGTQMGDGVRSTGSPMDLQYLQYIDLLTAEVTSLSAARQSTLLCYQMAGEPGDGAQTGMPNKSEFCSLTKEWYLRLKQGDPNHLVATGGYGPYSVWDGDPGVAMMDFYLLHFYKYPQNPKNHIYYTKYLPYLHHY